LNRQQSGFSATVVPLFVFLACFPTFWRKTGALVSLRQHVVFTNQQVAERGQKMQPVVVGKAAIADFAAAEDLLDVPKGGAPLWHAHWSRE